MGRIWSTARWRLIEEWFLDKARKAAPEAVAKLQNPRCTIRGRIIYIYSNYGPKGSKYIGAKISERPSFRDWWDEYYKNPEFEAIVLNDLKKLNSVIPVETDPDDYGLGYYASDFKSSAEKMIEKFPIDNKSPEILKADRIEAVRSARRKHDLGIDEAIEILQCAGMTLI